MRITVTSVLVDDQEKALRFYTDVLGFVKKSDGPIHGRGAAISSRSKRRARLTAKAACDYTKWPEVTVLHAPRRHRPLLRQLGAVAGCYRSATRRYREVTSPLPATGTVAVDALQEGN